MKRKLWKEDNNMSNISKNIRDIRIAHGETQKELAIAISVSESAIANYETLNTTNKNFIQSIAYHSITDCAV